MIKKIDKMNKYISKIELEKEGFIVSVYYPLSLRKKYRYYIYRFTYADIKEISKNIKTHLYISGSFIVEKYRIRLIGKFSWNYKLEKRMGSKVYIPINSNSKKKIERMMEVWFQKSNVR